MKRLIKRVRRLEAITGRVTRPDRGELEKFARTAEDFIRRAREYLGDRLAPVSISYRDVSEMGRVAEEMLRYHLRCLRQRVLKPDR